MTGSSWPRTFARPRIQRLGARHARDRGRVRQHLAGFLAREQERLAAETERDADPLRAGRSRLGLALRGRTGATVELPQQLERAFAQRPQGS